MRYQQLGNTGLTVSELGFGGIPILRLESSLAERIVSHAFEKGITFFVKHIFIFFFRNVF